MGISRLFAYGDIMAAVNGAQVSLDPQELREWMPDYKYGAHAFGLPNFQSLIDRLLK